MFSVFQKVFNAFSKNLCLKLNGCWKWFPVPNIEIPIRKFCMIFCKTASSKTPKYAGCQVLSRLKSLIDLDSSKLWNFEDLKAKTYQDYQTFENVKTKKAQDSLLYISVIAQELWSNLTENRSTLTIYIEFEVFWLRQFYPPQMSWRNTSFRL